MYNLALRCMVLKSVKAGNLVAQNSWEGSLQEARMKLGSKGQAVSTWINSSYPFRANLLPLLLSLVEFPRRNQMIY